MGNENWTPYNNVEEIMGQVKWTMTNPTKGRSLLKESDFVNMVGFLYSEFLPENQTIPTVLLPTKPTESNTWWKASRNNKQKNALSSTRIMLDHLSIWWPGKNCYSLAGKFWFIRRIHQTLHLRIFIYFVLYKILLMEKVSIPWKTVEGTWTSSLLKKTKSFGKMGLWSCLKNSRW